MSERTRRVGATPMCEVESTTQLVRPIFGRTSERTEDAEIREALNLVLGWSELLAEDELDQALRQRAVSAIERSARVLGTLGLEDHAEAGAAVSAALRVCADLRATGRA